MYRVKHCTFLIILMALLDVMLQFHVILYIPSFISVVYFLHFLYIGIVLRLYSCVENK